MKQYQLKEVDTTIIVLDGEEFRTRDAAVQTLLARVVGRWLYHGMESRDVARKILEDATEIEEILAERHTPARPAKVAT